MMQKIIRLKRTDKSRQGDETVNLNIFFHFILKIHVYTIGLRTCEGAWVVAGNAKSSKNVVSNDVHVTL